MEQMRDRHKYPPTFSTLFLSFFVICLFFRLLLFMLFDNIVFVYGRIHDYKKDIQAEGRGESEKGESRRLGGKGSMILEDFASDWY